MSVGKSGLLARRFAAGLVDCVIELSGGLLGSYFGAVVAALVIALRNGPADEIQASIWHGFGFGFAFWTLSVSFINRALIQGVSRASIGKKLFKLELISSRDAISWSGIISRWLLGELSFAFGGLGYLFALVDSEGRAFHDLVMHTDVVPQFSGHSLSVEYREGIKPVPVFMPELSRMLVLANTVAERPAATIIQLPTALNHGKTPALPTVAAANAPKETLAEVIQISRADATGKKKAA